MRVVMIGTGYVGLVSGAAFADFGHEVTCVDKDPQKIERLNAGDMPIFEPGLDALVERNVAAGRLQFTTTLEAVADADVIFLAVGTPTRRGDGHADLTYVYAAAREIAPHLHAGAVVVNKSTVPVGTGDEVEAIIREHAKHPFHVASNPEFLREGAAIDDFKRPDRVVVGVEHPDAGEVLKDLYRPLFLNETPMVVVDRRTAELIKYAANAFLATKITFINEMSDLCEKVGANVQQVAKGIGLDKRIGPKFLNVGPGYGGSCFPKDTLALSRTANDYGTPVSIVDAVIAANAARKTNMAKRIIEAAGDSVAGKTIAVLGLTFKQNTDDMRDAPSLDIIPALQKAGATIRAFDPEGRHEAEKHFEAVHYADDPYAAADGANLAVIITEWDQLRALDLKRLRTLLTDDLLVDLRNIYRPDDVLEAGLSYVCLGRKGVMTPPPTLRQVV